MRLLQVIRRLVAHGEREDDAHVVADADDLGAEYVPAVRVVAKGRIRREQIDGVHARITVDRWEEVDGGLTERDEADLGGRHGGIVTVRTIPVNRVVGP